MDKRAELLAKYFSDISKIFFATGIAKQIIEGKYNIKELLWGFFAAFITLIIAYFMQPKE